VQLATPATDPRQLLDHSGQELLQLALSVCGVRFGVLRLAGEAASAGGAAWPIEIEEPLARYAASHHAAAGVAAESVADAFAAMEKLRERDYCAVILDPMIRQRLNGFSVLNFLELEQPVIEACIPGSHARQTIRKSVLLVEDDRATASATIRVLDDLGYSAEWAQNGKEALDAVAAREFDAIMLDLVMPHVDGFAVLDQFHAERAALLRKVIVMTGMPDKYFAALDVSTLGGVVHKPLDVRRLEHLLVHCAYD
jgi:DNA-binding response OmpR family regulator